MLICCGYGGRVSGDVWVCIGVYVVVGVRVDACVRVSVGVKWVTICIWV